MAGTKITNLNAARDMTLRHLVRAFAYLEEGDLRAVANQLVVAARRGDRKSVADLRNVSHLEILLEGMIIGVLIGKAGR